MAGKRGGMSTVEYTRCDNPGCGRVTPDDPHEAYWATCPHWARVKMGTEEYDLCPDCAKKALEAVGVGA